jgi:hypothetical protein
MSANAVRQGRVYVEIGADPKKLFAALGTVNKRIGQLGSSMMSIGNRLMAAGTAITAPILGAAAAFSEVGDAVAKMAARTGMSTEAVSAFGFAAGQSGTDIGTLEKGVRTMQRTLDTAAQGGKAASKAFERLGVDVGALQQLSPEDQFLALSDALAAVEDPGERAALAMQVFGRAGTALLPMFSDGAAGIRALMAQAEQLGIVMDADTAKSAERLNDSIGELMTAFKAITVTVGAAVAPALSGLASSVALIAGQVAKYVSENKAFVQQALGVGAAFVAFGATLTAAGFALQAVSTGISALVGPLVSTIKVAYQVAASFVSATASVVMYGIKSVAAAAASLAAWVAANAPLAIAVGLLGAVGAAAIYAAGGFQGIASAIGGGFAEAGANAVTVLSDIGATATATFDGIYAELTAGNLMGAMDILWLGLKAGWARGSEAVMGEVDKWVVFLQNTWMHMGTAVATTWETMWSMLVQGGRTFGAVLQGAFDNVINGILAAWDTMEAAVRKSWNWVQSFIRKGYDLAKENNKVDSEMAARRQARAQQRPGVAGRMAAAEEANAGTAAQAQANIDAMNANAGRTARERIDASNDRAGARRTATQEAEAELGDALAASAERAAARAAEAAASPAAEQRIRQGAGAAATAMQRGEVAGTFSAAAVSGMGFAKSLAQRQVDLLERIADNTEEEVAVGA